MVLLLFAGLFALLFLEEDLLLVFLFVVFLVVFFFLAAVFFLGFLAFFAFGFFAAFFFFFGDFLGFFKAAALRRKVPEWAADLTNMPDARARLIAILKWTLELAPTL